MQRTRITYLSLGTNQGNKIENLQQAIDTIALRIGIVKKIASVYQTPALGFDGNDFYNTCIKVTTTLNPEVLIEKILQIEIDLGRDRSSKKEGYSNRPIDIDILLIDDEIIDTEKLIVPHPRMLARKFVLVPLKDITKKKVHPTTQQSIKTALKSCSDNSIVTEVDITLNKPISITEKYNYIAIEGNIGAGKTSFATLFSENFNARLILERFADNPFLPKFYEDKERYAFPLEMSFLADRFNQLSEDLAQFDLFKNCIVSDYYIFKSLIFAQITLAEEEYILYRRMFDIMYKEIRKPDLYVYLYQNTDRLLENIKKRGRDYEQNIEVQYLEQIQKGYMNFIKTQQDLNVLLIDVTEFDFVENESDYHIILNIISNHS